MDQPACCYQPFGHESELTEHDLGIKGSKPFNLSIYYTLGDFEGGRSLVYATQSEYHNTFYGVYLIKGLGDISKDEAVLEDIAQYDYSELVLRGLGYTESGNRFEVEQIK